jgi:hypothetical protein
MFEYDVAISFAGEQRAEAEAIAECLRLATIKVFYDKYEQANLWGKDLYEHLSDVYQKKARFCLMLVSAAYAEKVWTSHERKNAQARALLQKAEYILPVRFDETEIPGLPATVGYLRFQDHGVRGVCAALLQKLGSTADVPVPTPKALAPEPPEFWDQRKAVADTEIQKQIWTKPRWRIWIHPIDFKKARFKSAEHCREFMVSSYVVVRGWMPYPWFSTDALQTGEEWVTGEIDKSDGRMRRLERWTLFRSGQFVHNRAFDEILDLGDHIHVLEILDTVTGAFELAARMARRGVLSPEAQLKFELHSVAGRTLTWPQDVFGRRDALRLDCWSQDESFTVIRQVSVADLDARPRELALDATVEIFAKFGWPDPPKDQMAEEQRKRFGT